MIEITAVSEVDVLDLAARFVKHRRVGERDLFELTGKTLPCLLAKACKNMIRSFHKRKLVYATLPTSHRRSCTLSGSACGS